MVAALPEDHHLAERKVISIEDLASESFVSIAEEVAPGFIHQQTTQFARRGLVPCVGHEAPDPQAQLALIAAGVGVGLHLVPSSGARERGVAFVPLDTDVPTATLVLLWRSDDDRALVRLFLETARQVARSFERPP